MSSSYRPYRPLSHCNNLNRDLTRIIYYSSGQSCKKTNKQKQNNQTNQNNHKTVLYSNITQDYDVCSTINDFFVIKRQVLAFYLGIQAIKRPLLDLPTEEIIQEDFHAILVSMATILYDRHTDCYKCLRIFYTVYNCLKEF